jgi:hypothetical protein
VIELADIAGLRPKEAAASIGAVMSTPIGAGSAFGDVPAATLARLLRDAMRDLLGEPRALATDDPSLPS